MPQTTSWSTSAVVAAVDYSRCSASIAKFSSSFAAGYCGYCFDAYVLVVGGGGGCGCEVAGLRV